MPTAIGVRQDDAQAFSGIRERTRAGLAAAKRAGRTGGRPAKLTDEDLDVARTLLANPDIAVSDVASRLGVSSATLDRYLPAAKREARTALRREFCVHRVKVGGDLGRARSYTKEACKRVAQAAGSRLKSKAAYSLDWLVLRAREVLTLVETRKDAVVKGSNRVELDWLLKCKMVDLVSVIRPLSAESCEQYAKAILSQIGGPSFEELLSRIVEAMVKADGGVIPKSSDEYYFAVRD